MATAIALPPLPAPQGGNLTLAEVWKSYAARNQFSESTVHQYEIQLRHFDRYLGRPSTTADLDDDLVTLFPVDRAKATTPANANKTRNHILALWRFAWRKRWVYEAPDVKPLKQPRRNPDAWSAAEFARLVGTAYLGEGWLTRATTGGVQIAGVPANLWWAGLLLAIYNTGGRIGALLKMPPGDVDLVTGRIMLRAEYSKTLTDEPFVLDPATVAILRQFYDAQRERLFPFPFSRSTLYNYLRRIVKAAGLPIVKRGLFHKVRRTVATLSEIHIGAGAATGIMGHSSRAVTVRSYIDRSKLPDACIGERLPRALLVGHETEAGHAPSVASMLPSGPPAPVPIEHCVTAVILPPESTGPEDHPLLHADPLDLIPQFTAAQRCSVLRQREIAWQLRQLFLELRLKAVREIAPQAVWTHLEAALKTGEISLGMLEERVWALRRFLNWLVSTKGVYAVARAADEFSRTKKRIAALKPFDRQTKRKPPSPPKELAPEKVAGLMLVAQAARECTPQTALADFFQRFYVPGRLRGSNERTLALYVKAIGCLGKWLRRPPTIGDLSRDTLAAFAEGEAARSQAPATIASRLAILMAMGAHAKRCDLIEADYGQIALPAAVVACRAAKIRQLRSQKGGQA